MVVGERSERMDEDVGLGLGLWLQPPRALVANPSYFLPLTQTLPHHYAHYVHSVPSLCSLLPLVHSPFGLAITRPA